MVIIRHSLSCLQRGCHRAAQSLPTVHWRNSSNLLLGVDKDDLTKTHIFETQFAPLKENEVRLKVEKFALTSNTITYGKVGTKIGYFDFYPPPTPSSSTTASVRCVPAIGWARVVESNVANIPVGGKHFGWYPMAEYCTVEAVPSKSGFKDIGAHRKANAEVYKEFIRTDLDPFRDSSVIDSTGEDDYEDRQAILRGLFLTSFLADEFLADELTYFRAKSVIIVSASSKTALGIAQRISNKNKSVGNLSERMNVIGVTSSGNASFVASTGFYDQTVTYDNIGTSISETEDAVVIDMSGNWRVIEEIHRHLGDHLKHSMAIGLSHHDSGYAPKSLVLPGPKPSFFFAPAEVARRMKEWGPTEFHLKSALALSSFITGSQTWMEVTHAHGVECVHREWLNAHDGNIPPNIGVIASMHELD